MLVFVYEKTDNEKTKTCKLDIKHSIFVESKQTADFQTTTGLLNILNNSGNVDDIIACLNERYLPIDDIQAHKLAEEILKNHPTTGYLTISNALQWRLQYSRIIEKAGEVNGVYRII